VEAKKIVIFDTTLRDGEQCPGATMNPSEKLAIAKMLDLAGVDVIEAGFAASSKMDFDAIYTIAQNMQNAKICSLSRAVKSDIEASAKAVSPCKKGGRIHTFLATSPIHREFKLKKSKEQILEMIAESVSLAKSLCDDIEWSAEDATRTELDFLAQCVEVAISAGATTINLPDTVGFATPEHIKKMIQYIQANVQNIEKAIISMHCQNDLGLATANTLAAIESGAGQIEVTINGIGERAGNTSLEEVIMAIKTRGDLFPNADISHFNTKMIKPLSDLVSNITGFAVQNNKAIVGANAFAHESGIHQDGMLKNRSTYEIIDPITVGIEETKIVLGKHSGKNALKSTISRLGFEIENEQELEKLFEKFKNLAENKKTVSDGDIIHLLKGTQTSANMPLQLLGIIYNNNGGKNTAFVLIELYGEKLQTEFSGNGMIDSIFQGIKTLVKLPENLKLGLYQVHAVTGGTDALGSATVRLERDGNFFMGTASDLDVIKASALAYVNAVNLFLTK
jgi:2-isopropylmalate synthase